MSNRNDIRRIKYHFVLNITGDPNIARRARMWSLDRISREFAVSTERTYYGKVYNIIERPPRIYKLTERQRNNRRSRFNMRDIDVTPRTRVPVSKVKHEPTIGPSYDDSSDKYPFDDTNIETDRIIPRLPIITTMPKPVTSNIDKYWADIKSNNKFPSNVDSREGNWAFWAQSGNEYPDYITDTVRRINKNANKRPDDSYGFAMVYYMYVNELSYNNLQKSIKPHKYIDDFYEDNLKHLGV